MNSKTTPCYQYEINVSYLSGSQYKTLHTYLISKVEETNYVLKENIKLV